jgi:hypothetical protein
MVYRTTEQHSLMHGHETLKNLTNMIVGHYDLPSLLPTDIKAVFLCVLNSSV